MATRNASDVLALFHTRIDTITTETPDSGLTRSGYRLTLGQEPDGPADGLYFVDIESILPEARTFGRQENIWAMNVNVEVGYFMGGGDMDGGDRQTLARNAANDIMRLADVLTAPTGYDGSNTGVREIRFQSGGKVIDAPHKQVWRAQFWVQWQSDTVTT